MADGGRIAVGFPAERTARAWERRYETGEVPGRWPYGLDTLDRVADVEAVELANPGRLARARRRLGLSPRPLTDAVGLTWDENAALRMRTVRPYRVSVSGVVWATDSAARGADVAAVLDVLRRADRLWVLSVAQVEPLARLIGPGGPAVEYVRFGIDPDFFAAAPAAATPRVVSVGGDRDRDTETLFAALERVHAARPEVELVVQTASNLTPPAGVQTVRHLPHVELRDLYATASVVAIATRENLHVSGMTVSLEAMSTGRPVAITASPGMADYVADTETGLLSAQGDPAALAENVLALLADTSGAEAMGLAGRRAVERRFTSTAMTEQLARVAGEAAG